MTADEEGGSSAEYYFAENIKSEFTIFNQNIRSLNKNIMALKQYLDRVENVKIITLQECWQLTGNEEIPGFNIISKTRSISRGGGVAIAISNKLNYKEIKSIYVESVFESVGIEINIGKKNYDIYSIYTPPKTPFFTILSYIEQMINNRKNSNKLILAGDYNTNILLPENAEFLDQLSAWSLIPLYTCPTRVNSKSSTSLDLIFTNEPSAQGGCIESDITDHMATFATLQDTKNKLSYKMIPDHSKKSLENLRQTLANTDFDCVMTDDTPTAFTTFEKILIEAKEKCCPLKKIKFKDKMTEPWFSSAFRVSRNKKDRLRRKARIKKSPQSWEKFTRYRKIYYKLCKVAKFMFYQKQFQINKNDGKKLWQLTNTITGRKSCKSSVITMPDCSTDHEVANKFQNYYANIATDLAKTIPEPDNHYKHYLPKEEPDTKLKFKPVFPSQVAKIIDNMRPKTSYGWDHISNLVLKEIKNEIKLPLSHLINISIANNVFPDSWKISRVIPIHKGGQKDDCGNYRPISLVPCLSKVIETAIVQQVTHHLETNQLYFANQFGFRKYHRTESMLLKYQQAIFQAKQAKQHCISVQIDCRKAFDTIKHDILLTKIEKLGLPQKWFESYLSNRKMFVNIGNENSAETEINIGVPQGSVLGSCLFSIYINEMPLCTDMATLLFADDSTFIYTSYDIKELFEKVNKELEKIQQWCYSNQLCLHPKKTNYFFFSCSKINSTPELLLNNQRIQRVGENFDQKTHKILGVHFDEKMQFKTHIQHIQNKIRAALAILARSKVILPYKIKLLIYNALIMSHINYCSSIWSGSPDIDKIEKLQKKAIRIICQKKYADHTDPLFHKTKTLKVEHLIELNFLKISNNILNSKESLPIINIFNFLNITNKRTRSDNLKLMKTPKCRIKILQGFPQYKLPSIYNNALKNYPCKIDKKISNLTSSYKKWRIMQYGQFKCTDKSCYSCKK